MATSFCQTEDVPCPVDKDSVTNLCILKQSTHRTDYTSSQVTILGLYSTNHQTYLLSRTGQYNLFLFLGLRYNSFTVYVMKLIDNELYNASA